MTASRTSAVIEHLRRAVLLRDGGGLTDGQLLEDYLRRREGSAFAALVHRHGPMVWGVCRRVLHDHHDAEDAAIVTYRMDQDVVARDGALVIKQRDCRVSNAWARRDGRWVFVFSQMTQMP